MNAPLSVHDAIRTKRAVRKFTPESLPEAVTVAILNAGRRAQSSKNAQPWHFIAITDKVVLKQLSECGQMDSEGRTNTWHLAGAALGVALLSENPEEKIQRLFDLGQAAAYMQLAAWELGVGSCLASIYEAEKARQILGFPSEWHLRIALSFGYPLKEEKLSSPPKKGGRKALEEVVHWQKW
jgi:nitroreductase